MTAIDSKSYPGYLNKLIDEYNNTCNNTIMLVLLVKILLMLIVLLKLLKLNRAIKFLNLTLIMKSGLLNTIIFLGKFTPKTGQEEYLSLIPCWELIHERIKSK